MCALTNPARKAGQGARSTASMALPNSPQVAPSASTLAPAVSGQTNAVFIGDCGTLRAVRAAPELGSGFSRPLMGRARSVRSPVRLRSVGVPRGLFKREDVGMKVDEARADGLERAFAGGAGRLGVVREIEPR